MQVVLVAPEIPPNTGNVARTCAATGTPLHLVDPLGFQLSDRYLRRAGLDYWPAVDLHRHESWEALLATEPVGRFWAFSTKGTQAYTAVNYEPSDWLVFGCESKGLPPELLACLPTLRIPIRPPVRSLNLGSSVAIALFEAIRQTTPELTPMS